MRPIALVLIAAAMLALPGQAMPAETDPARFSFKDVADGVLRLDSRTGQVSLCSRASAAQALGSHSSTRTCSRMV